jgi:MFS family permease
MHSDLPPAGLPDIDDRPWYKTLTRYHWFVLTVAALGWLFDTMDQQLFNLARMPAMRALVTSGEDPAVARARVNAFGGYATSIFLIGWATGGLAFGVLGDRIGRAKTMLLTILLYSLFTGLSALSVGFWDFAVYRFLTGLGVGGEFAVGVSLVAEVMPDKARPFALGLLQALSAVGNIAAALISIALGALEESGAIGDAWRPMFLIGTVPALLCLLIFKRLKEPERWQAMKKAAAEGGTQKLGSLAELFSDARWRKRALVGLLLSSSGIIGLWAIGFFSFDLTRLVFRKTFEAEARARGEATNDLAFVRTLMAESRRLAGKPNLVGEDKEEMDQISEILVKIQPDDLLDLEGQKPDEPHRPDIQPLYKTLVFLAKKQNLLAREVADPLAQTPHTRAMEEAYTRLMRDIQDAFIFTPDTILAVLEQQELARRKDAANVSAMIVRLRGLLTVPPSEQSPREYLSNYQQHVAARSKEISGRLTLWAGITSVMLNLGAAFGIYAFTHITHFTGRRPAFAVSYILALLSTAWVFWTLDKLTDVFWVIPVMGFCQLALFGGYAIYFPELFPTRLRSTGISFCYNVARYLAAAGPSMLGILSSEVFSEQKGFVEPMRYAGLTMCSVFLIGLCALPFAPETKGKPLPE